MGAQSSSDPSLQPLPGEFGMRGWLVRPDDAIQRRLGSQTPHEPEGLGSDGEFSCIDCGLFFSDEHLEVHHVRRCDGPMYSWDCQHFLCMLVFASTILEAHLDWSALS